jgi:aconitate decarboxylase
MASGEGVHTRALARYIAGNHDADFPSDLVHRMKLLTLDTIGCGLLTTDLPWTVTLRETLQATEAPGPSLLWGTEGRLSPALAAMVNGTAVHGFELDDVGARGHFGAVTTTVALALAEAGAEVSGPELIGASITGIEVATHIARCVGQVPHVECGFHGPGLFGAFAAGAAAAYALRLDEQQCVYTLANVAQFTGGLMATHHGGMGKRLLLGKAAHSGVLAAQLAAHGFTNVENVFECGYGSFPSAFSGGRDTFDLDKLDAGLGTEYLGYGVNFKMWACRVPIHPILEAVKSLQGQGTIDPDRIEHVKVSLPTGSFRAVGFPYVPTSIASAQLNAQYCLAIMLLEGDVFIDQFTEEKIRAPRVLDLIKRIEIACDENLDSGSDGGFARQTTVQITLSDGSELQADGAVRTNVTQDDVVAKFRKTSKAKLSPSAQDRVIEMSLGLDSLGKATEILPSLTISQ